MSLITTCLQDHNVDLSWTAFTINLVAQDHHVDLSWTAFTVYLLFLSGGGGLFILVTGDQQTR